MALPTVLLLVLLFGLGILLSMSLFGVVLARVLSLRKLEARRPRGRLRRRRRVDGAGTLLDHRQVGIQNSEFRIPNYTVL